MTTHKAKRMDNGEWVEGHFVEPNWIIGEEVDSSEEYFYPEFWTPIVKDTLCERVRGTEFFEGDEVTDGKVKAYVEYDDLYSWWQVVITTEAAGRLTSQLGTGNWKPTGKNKHD